MSEDNKLKFLPIVTAMLLIADINLVYSGEILDCNLVCTRPGTSLDPDKCMCISDKKTPSDQSSSMQYIGSKITENGSEITIYREKGGDFIAIYPDKEPPNHYKKSKTLRGALGFKETDKKASGTDLPVEKDHKAHKKISKQIPNIKKKSGSEAAIDKKVGEADLHGGVDHKSHKKISKQTPNIKKESADTVVLGGRAFKIGKKEGGTDLHGAVDHTSHIKISKNTSNTKIMSGSTAGLIKNTNGTDKIFATITKRGTGEKIRVYKDSNSNWLTFGKDGSPVRYGRGKSLEDIYKVENHEGPISARDKYQIELDKWKREEAYRKKLETAEEAIRYGKVVHKPHKKSSGQTSVIKMKSVDEVELVKNKDGTNKVYATITKRGVGGKVKVYKGITSGDWVTYDKDGNSIRHKKGKSLEDIFKAENHEGPISARDKYQIELDKWKREEAYRKKLEVAEKAAVR